ncbi:MAG TPA: hypothetical protein DCS63_07120 [Elusimicrobia bacterium]|nr:hypothetical protein [Elusimicrobiota bacterium]
MIVHTTAFSHGISSALDENLISGILAANESMINSLITKPWRGRCRDRISKTLSEGEAYVSAEPESGRRAHGVRDAVFAFRFR